VSPLSVVEALDVVEDLAGESRRVGQEWRCTSSFFSVAKKLSAAALSKQSPFDPIDLAIPASPAVWPNARLTYCDP